MMLLMGNLLYRHLLLRVLPFVTNSHVLRAEIYAITMKNNRATRAVHILEHFLTTCQNNMILQNL